jgi:hypothetical protein
MQTYQYATIEWVWNQESFRINMPDGEEVKQYGTYNELVDLLNQMGQQGWEVATCAAAGNWLFWTLKKPS